MDRKSEIEALKFRLSLNDDELKVHHKAQEKFSRTGDEKFLDGIPQDKRDTIAQFYKELRKLGIYGYEPDTGKFGFVTDYVSLWLHILRNKEDRPEFANLTRNDVQSMLKNSYEAVKERMRHGGSISRMFPESKETVNDVIERLKMPRIKKAGHA